MAPLGPDFAPNAPDLPPDIADGRAAVGAALQVSAAPISDSERIMQLCEGGNSDAAQNLLRNASEGSLPKAAALALIQTGEGYAVVQNLKNFHGLDHKEIALVLIQAGEDYAVAKYLENFHGLDHKEIALALIQAGKGYAVAEYLHNFYGLDQEVALALIQAGEGSAVVRNLENFHGLDHKEIALALIAYGYPEYIIPVLERFAPAEHQQLITAIMRAGHYAGVGAKFASGAFAPEILDSCILEDIAQHDELFYFAIFHPKNDSQPTTTDILLERLWDRCREDAAFGAAVQVAMHRCIDHAIAESDYGIARELADLFVQRTGRALLPEQERVLQHETERVVEPVDLSLPEQPISVPSEIVRYYAIEQVRAVLIQLQHQARARGQEFSLQHQLIMRDAQAAIDRTQHATCEWLRRYLVVAVQSEIQHADETHLASLPTVATPSEIRAYLYRAAYVFNNSHWSLWSLFGSSYGGPAWAKIAQLGAQCWREPGRRLPESILIDSAFHIEHNNCFVFDKANDRIKYENTIQKQLLDMKRDAADWSVFREQAIRLLDIVPEHLIEVDRLMQQLQRIRPQPKGRD